MSDALLGLICPGVMFGGYLLVVALLFTGPRANSRHWDD